MTFSHADMVRKLKKPGDVILAALTPKKCEMDHMTVGVCGEAGELLDAIKKHVFYNAPLNMGNVIEELGDIEFYLEGLRTTLGITREETLVGNTDKLGKRYTGYSDQQAQDRADKK